MAFFIVACRFFKIPAGATITNSGTAAGFGATGSASWETTVKTGDFTAVAGVGYFVNTTSGEIDVTLPAGTAGAATNGHCCSSHSYSFPPCCC